MGVVHEFNVSCYNVAGVVAKWSDWTSCFPRQTSPPANCHSVFVVLEQRWRGAQPMSLKVKITTSFREDPS